MTLRKLLAAVLALTMLLTTAACGQSEPSSASSATSSTGGSQASSAPTQPVDITFWHSMDGVFAEVLDKQVAMFNDTIGKEKGITVTSVFQNWPGTESLVAAMANDDIKNMPDVIQLYSESVNLVQDYKRTVWVEDYIGGANATLKKTDLIPNAAANYTINDKLIGVPYSVSALMLYYNKDYFEKAGVAAPPKTIAEMAAIMPDLVSKTDADFGLNVRVQLYELENWIATQGAEGSWFGNNNSGHSGAMTELAADKDGSLDRFLTEWQKVVGSGAYKATRDSINDEFAAGMHAMVIMSSSRIPTIDGLVGDSFSWDVAPIPTVSADDVGGCTPSGSGLFMLDRDDQGKKDASWEFVQFMASAEAQTMWLDGAGYVPANIHAQQLDSYKSAVAAEPRLQTPYDALMKATPKIVQSFCPNSGTVDGVIKDAMIAFGNKEADKDATYKAITEGAARAFEEYYRANPAK